MTKDQVKMFEELLASDDFKGKSQLKHLLRLNTSISKYKIGEYVKVTDLDHSIYGIPVNNFNGKVVDVYSFKNEDSWHYEVEMIIKTDNAEKIMSAYVSEDDLDKNYEFTNVNVIKAKSSTEDAIMI